MALICLLLYSSLLFNHPISASPLTSQNLHIAHNQQVPLTDDNLRASSPVLPPKRVAIIGGGLGGALIARNFARIATNLSSPIEVSIYDRGQRLGGRLLSQFSHFTPEPLELGSQYLPSSSDELNSIIKELELETAPASIPSDFGIWNSDQDSYSYQEASWEPDWVKRLHRRLKWGDSPTAAQELFERLFKLMTGMYNGDKVEDLLLIDESLHNPSTREFLLHHNISDAFMSEYIVPAARARYGQPLSNLNGLASILSLNDDTGFRLREGNEVLVRRIIEQSGATVHEAVDIKNITRNYGNSTYSLQYLVPGKTKSGKHFITRTSPPPIRMEDNFDAVLIAAPWRQANISVTPPLDEFITPVGRPYAAQHITHIVTDKEIAGPGYVNTIGADVPFNSLRFVQRFPVSDGSGERFLYRFSSSELLLQSAISRLISPSHVRWVHRHKWTAGYAEQAPFRRIAEGDPVEIEFPGGKYYIGGLFYVGAKDWYDDGVDILFRWAEQMAKGVACIRLGGDCDGVRQNLGLADMERKV